MILPALRSWWQNTLGYLAARSSISAMQKCSSCSKTYRGGRGDLHLELKALILQNLGIICPKIFLYHFCFHIQTILDWIFSFVKKKLKGTVLKDIPLTSQHCHPFTSYLLKLAWHIIWYAIKTASLLNGSYQNGTNQNGPWQKQPLIKMGFIQNGPWPKHPWPNGPLSKMQSG